MTTADKIQEYTNTIFHNQLKECEWNDKMQQAKGEKEFEEIVVARSKDVRRFYEANAEALNLLEECMKDLTEESANALYEAARNMHINGRIDPALICKLADPAIAYFKEHGIEEEKAIILSAVRFAAHADYYSRMIPELKLEENLAHAEWIISHKDRYCEYEDVRVRANIFMAYAGAISTFIITEQEQYIPRMTELIKESTAMWASEEVQKMDGTNPVFGPIAENLNFILPWEAGLYFMQVGETFERMEEIIEPYMVNHLHEDLWNEKFLSDLIRIRQKSYRKELTYSDAVDETVKLIESLPEADWANDPANSQYVLQNFGMAYICVMHYMKEAKLPFEEREQRVKALNVLLDEIVSGIPYQYHNSYISSLVQGFFVEAVKNVREPEMVEGMINDLLLKRQPSTFFHSLMVGEIATLIAKEMIDKEPTLFTSLSEYPTEQAVRDNSEKILDTIRSAARMHDLGKCTIASVIMQQSRKINEDEFTCIKIHPKMGAEYLDTVKGFDLYKEVNLGHHKTYDGKGGYPEDYDNTASPYRILIDLISISDSTDAATDITGRNYAMGKDFMKLLEELKEGAGTRYNPDIVRIMANSPELIEKLVSLTGKERISHLYKVYNP